MSIIKGKLFFLAVLHSMLDLGSLARDQTLQGSVESQSLDCQASP